MWMQLEKKKKRVERKEGGRGWHGGTWRPDVSGSAESSLWVALWDRSEGQKTSAFYAQLSPFQKKRNIWKNRVSPPVLLFPELNCFSFVFSEENTGCSKHQQRHPLPSDLSFCAKWSLQKSTWAFVGSKAESWLRLWRSNTPADKTTPAPLLLRSLFSSYSPSQSPVQLSTWPQAANSLSHQSGPREASPSGSYLVETIFWMGTGDAGSRVKLIKCHRVRVKGRFRPMQLDNPRLEERMENLQQLALHAWWGGGGWTDLDKHKERERQGPSWDAQCITHTLHYLSICLETIEHNKANLILLKTFPFSSSLRSQKPSSHVEKIHFPNPVKKKMQ